MEVPSQWPPAVAQVYEPVRVLGRGGFAAVTLARRKQTKGGEGAAEFAALKVVGSANGDSSNTARTEAAYAHR